MGDGLPAHQVNGPPLFIGERPGPNHISVLIFGR